MRIEIRALVDVQECYKFARGTQGLSEPKKQLSVEKWRRWLYAEESQIRTFTLRADFYYVPYWVHVHLIRHHIGNLVFPFEPFVRSQRPDNYNPVDYDRGSARQDALIDMPLFTNPQALINMARKRLCHNASKETREAVELLKSVVSASDNEYIAAIADVMLPDCEYRGNICYSTRPCGLYASAF